jgi:hypothetical protein
VIHRPLPVGGRYPIRSSMRTWTVLALLKLGVELLQHDNEAAAFHMHRSSQSSNRVARDRGPASPEPIMIASARSLFPVV